MHPLAEPLLADAHQVLEREGRQAARLRIGPGKHNAHQLGLLLRVELGRTPIAPAVGEPVDPMLVVADDPVAQSLAVHACRPGRLLPAHAIERVGDRQDAASNARIWLGLRQFAQHCRAAIATYGKCPHPALHRINQ